MKMIIMCLVMMICSLHSYGGRIVYTEEQKRIMEMDDQVALAKIAKSNKDERTRFMALRRLEDQVFLMEIATNNEDENERIRYEAAQRLNDQALLEEFAKNFKDKHARQRAVCSLTNKVVLLEIAQNDNEAWIRFEAIRKLGDNELLAKFAKDKKNDDGGARLHAAWQLEDLATIAEIAKNDENPHVRRHAIEILKSLFLKSAKNDSNAGVRFHAIRAYAYGDKKRLMDFAWDTKNGIWRVNAALALKDQPLLAHLAKNAKDEDVRWEAVMFLDDQALLEKIAEYDKDNSVRKNARWRLEKLRNPRPLGVD